MIIGSGPARESISGTYVIMKGKSHLNKDLCHLPSVCHLLSNFHGRNVGPPRESRNVGQGGFLSAAYRGTSLIRNRLPLRSYRLGKMADQARLGKIGLSLQARLSNLQGYLAHTKTRSPGILLLACMYTVCV